MAQDFNAVNTPPTDWGAYAGEAAMVDNTSVIFRNPAAMSSFERTATSVGGVLIAPSIDLECMCNVAA